jgi:UDP-glucose 4-epimerase
VEKKPCRQAVKPKVFGNLIERKSMSRYENKTLLITGGTGSFGNAVLRRFRSIPMKQIRILSRDEKKQDDMRNEYRDPRIKYYIGDVRNIDSIREAVDGADYIFHAAALKQVPSCEFYPMEAVRTNIIGTDNLLQAALDSKVGKVVVLSTDKAAYPINAMGMSKAIMEKTMVARARSASEHGLIFCGTRYGNVMASRGSVIPLFIQQIESGLRITVTDPEMTRFMMNLDSAIDLVLFAFEHGNPGDRFVQKAPAATILTLVEALKSLMNASNEVTVIGTRHGEKLYETLLTREEMIQAEDIGNYFRVPADTRDLNYNLFLSEGKSAKSEIVDYNSHNCTRLNMDGMSKLLMTVQEVRNAVVRLDSKRD